MGEDYTSSFRLILTAATFSFPFSSSFIAGDDYPSQLLTILTGDAPSLPLKCDWILFTSFSLTPALEAIGMKRMPIC